MRTWTGRAAGAAALALTSLTLAPPAHAADSMVSLLHGVPGATVDVYANGEALLTGFEPGTLTDPVALAEGSYDIKVVAAGAGPNGQAVIEANGVLVPGGADLTVAAHLTADGTPTLTPFVNDTSALAAGQARLTVRHIAAAPAVDVRADEQPVFTGLSNPDEASADLPAGAVSADVVLAGTTDVVIGPADLDLAEGVNTIVYAWGSAQDGNLQLAVQSVAGMDSAPGGVPSGTGGQAAGGGLPLGWMVAGAVGAGAVALVLVRPRTRRAV